MTRVVGKDIAWRPPGMVAVTGASGFIGSRICEVLLKDGAGLRVFGRNELGVNSEFYCWDLKDSLDRNALTGVDAVFHLAGKAHALAETSQDEAEYVAINTEATRKLLIAARVAGVKTFVYFSSVKAVGEVDGVMDESVSEPADTPYGRSKRAAEKLVLEGGYVPHPVVIRPSMVYGNTEKGNLPRMIQAIAAGRFPPLPEVYNRRSMVHVDDVVQAAMLAADHDDAAGKIYIVTDGHRYSTRQIYEWICQGLHRSIPGWHLPLLALKLMGWTGDMIGAIRGRRFIFDSDALEKLIGDACYSSQRIQDELGFKPVHNLRQSLPEIIACLRANRP